jgi:hypothetical protein
MTKRRFTPWIVLACIGTLAACTSGDDGTTGNTELNVIVPTNAGTPDEIDVQTVEYTIACAGNDDTFLDNDDSFADQVRVDGNLEVVDGRTSFGAGAACNGGSNNGATCDQANGDDDCPGGTCDTIADFGSSPGNQGLPGNRSEVWQGFWDLPPGPCSLQLRVRDNDGEVICTATEPFFITADATVKVNVLMMCNTSFQAPVGHLDVDATFSFNVGNFCPDFFVFNAADSGPLAEVDDIGLGFLAGATTAEVRLRDGDSGCGDNCDPQTCVPSAAGLDCVPAHAPAFCVGGNDKFAACALMRCTLGDAPDAPCTDDIQCRGTSPTADGTCDATSNVDECPGTSPVQDGVCTVGPVTTIKCSSVPAASFGMSCLAGIGSGNGAFIGGEDTCTIFGDQTGLIAEFIPPIPCPDNDPATDPQNEGDDFCAKAIGAPTFPGFPGVCRDNVCNFTPFGQVLSASVALVAGLPPISFPGTPGPSGVVLTCEAWVTDGDKDCDKHMEITVAGAGLSPCQTLCGVGNENDCAACAQFVCHGGTNAGGACPSIGPSGDCPGSTCAANQCIENICDDSSGSAQCSNPATDNTTACDDFTPSAGTCDGAGTCELDGCLVDTDCTGPGACTGQQLCCNQALVDAGTEPDCTTPDFQCVIPPPTANEDALCDASGGAGSGHCVDGSCTANDQCDQDPANECPADVCQGGSNPGVPCPVGDECLGGGTCAATSSDACDAASSNVGAPCTSNTDCTGGDCITPDAECVAPACDTSGTPNLCAWNLLTGTQPDCEAVSGQPNSGQCSNGICGPLPPAPQTVVTISSCGLPVAVSENLVPFPTQLEVVPTSPALAGQTFSATIDPAVILDANFLQGAAATLFEGFAIYFTELNLTAAQVEVAATAGCTPLTCVGGTKDGNTCTADVDCDNPAPDDGQPYEGRCIAAPGSLTTDTGTLPRIITVPNAPWPCSTNADCEKTNQLDSGICCTGVGAPAQPGFCAGGTEAPDTFCDTSLTIPIPCLGGGTCVGTCFAAGECSIASVPPRITGGISLDSFDPVSYSCTAGATGETISICTTGIRAASVAPTAPPSQTFVKVDVGALLNVGFDCETGAPQNPNDCECSKSNVSRCPQTGVTEITGACPEGALCFPANANTAKGVCSDPLPFTLKYDPTGTICAAIDGNAGDPCTTSADCYAPCDAVTEQCFDGFSCPPPNGTSKCDTHGGGTCGPACAQFLIP